MTHCRVGIQLPSVEVRFQDLTVEAQAEAAGRELPSIFNSYRNWVEVSPRMSGLCDCQYGVEPSHGLCTMQTGGRRQRRGR